MNEWQQRFSEALAVAQQCLQLASTAQDMLTIAYSANEDLRGRLLEQHVTIAALRAQIAAGPK